MLSLVRWRSVRTLRTALPLGLPAERSRPGGESSPGGHLHPRQRHAGTLSVCRTHVGSLRGYCATGHDTNLSSSSSCWRCQQCFEERPTFFCPRCKVVQPTDESASHFQILDCDHSFTLDTQKLQKMYLKLQRSLHPDNFSQKTEEEQGFSEQQSALLNRAYRTLLKPLSRGLYMLELEGMPIEEGTISGGDPSLLMELMELNEAVEEADTAEAADRIGQDTKVKLMELTAQIDDALREGEYKAAKALLIQMKYFANVEEKVKERLSKLM